MSTPTRRVRFAAFIVVNSLGFTGCSTAPKQAKGTLATGAAGAMTLDRLNCEAWDRSSRSPARVPLNLSAERDSLSGQTQGDQVRYIVELRNGKVFLALFHRERLVGVSHGFSPEDSRIELTLSADDPKGKTASATFDLSCR